MTTLRASSGSTSSGVIFWLIAAILKNERSGPGIATSSAVEESLASDDGGGAETFEVEGGVPGLESAASKALPRRSPQYDQETTRRKYGQPLR